MRVVNTKGETISEYDLTKGRLITRKILRADAKPIDNEEKFEVKVENGNLHRKR